MSASVRDSRTALPKLDDVSDLGLGPPGGRSFPASNADGRASAGRPSNLI